MLGDHRESWVCDVDKNCVVDVGKSKEGARWVEGIGVAPAKPGLADSGVFTRVPITRRVRNKLMISHLGGEITEDRNRGGSPRWCSSRVN